MSAERVDDGDPFDLPAAAHVFGIEFPAIECTGVAMIALSQYEKPWAALISNAPVRIKRMISWTLNRVHAETRPTAGLVSERVGTRRPRRLDIEFLQHLNRQRIIVSIEQRDGSLSFDGIPADPIQQNVRVEEMGHRSSVAAVSVVARQPVRCVEVDNALAKRALLALQSLGFAFSGGKLDEELLNQRGHRRIALGGYDAGATVGLIVE
jgi:hypothetical protein